MPATFHVDLSESGEDAWFGRHVYQESCALVGAAPSKADPCTATTIGLSSIVYRPPTTSPGRYIRLAMHDYFKASALDAFGTLHTAFPFHAIADIQVTGSCACNGHATVCTAADGSTTWPKKCTCAHNTKGNTCEACTPFHYRTTENDGRIAATRDCVECSCNGHADSCDHGGCIGCKKNTAGQGCEICAIGFYINSNVPRDSDEACTPTFDPLMF